jgi:hypothetical protein
MFRENLSQYEDRTVDLRTYCSATAVMPYMDSISLQGTTQSRLYLENPS